MMAGAIREVTEKVVIRLSEIWSLAQLAHAEQCSSNSGGHRSFQGG